MNILFIGNSYTFYNDMPRIFAELAAVHDPSVKVDSVTSGGYTLASYLDTRDIFANRLSVLLKNNKYDYIVLQEQSVRPANEPERFFESCRALAELARPTGAKLLFYQTWGRRDDHPVLARLGMTHEQMHAALKVSYEQIAAELGGRVVYAGDALSRAYRGEHGDAVYNADGTHPSLLGSQIIARVFAETIFG